MENKLAIGVDIGGSHISCAAYDLEQVRYLEETYADSSLDNHAPAGEIIAVWGKAIGETMEMAGPENVGGIGFAMPGPFDYPNGISRFRGENGKYENTYGLDVPAGIRNILNLPHDFRIRFINDATAFAIGEDRFGMAREYRRSLSITLGTGFGSAFISDGLPVLQGPEVPGQGCLWHLPYEGGIADDYFSTRGFLGRYHSISGKKAAGVRELAELAHDDLIVKGLFDDFGSRLAQFLKPWLTSFKCEILVMGGNISNAYDLFSESLAGGLSDTGVTIRTSGLGESAAMIGSAHLVDDNFYHRILPLLTIM